MTKIEDSELKNVSGGGDQAQAGGPGGGIVAEIDVNQGGGTGDEDDQDNAVGRTDGGQQHLG